jgi:hypothetical protein
LATTVQVPTPRSEIVAPFLPLAEHTDAGAALNVTVSPEVDVALTVNDPLPKARFASAAN